MLSEFPICATSFLKWATSWTTSSDCLDPTFGVLEVEVIMGDAPVECTTSPWYRCDHPRILGASMLCLLVGYLEVANPGIPLDLVGIGALGLCLEVVLDCGGTGLLWDPVVEEL